MYKKCPHCGTSCVFPTAVRVLQETSSCCITNKGIEILHEIDNLPTGHSKLMIDYCCENGHSWLEIEMSYPDGLLITTINTFDNRQEKEK